MPKWKFAVCSLLVSLLAAQEADTVLKVDVDVVNLLFSVRDKKGALVRAGEE
ncbi:MAG: hypothetical protein WKF37_01145 [Bryobacteraceae bacterium]